MRVGIRAAERPLDGRIQGGFLSLRVGLQVIGQEVIDLLHAAADILAAGQLRHLADALHVRVQFFVFIA